MIGQVITENDEEIMLTNPREVQIMQVGPNQTKFTVLHIFGKPNSITIQKRNIMIQYDLEDPSIINIYEEHISTIRKPQPNEIEQLTNKIRH